MRAFSKSIISHSLAFLARLVLLRRKPKIVAITGSVGKTSSKDAIAKALSVSFSVRKSEKSFNSDIGVPLTILNLKNAWGNPFFWLLNLIKGVFEVVSPESYPEWLVLEVGADKPGDLKKIFSWLTPDVVVATRFPKVPVHVAFYSSPEALIEEESIPLHHVKEGGLLVLNWDDEKARAFKKEKVRVLTYGLTLGADVLGSSASVLYEGGVSKKPLGMKFRIDYRGSSVPLEIKGVLGVQNLFSILSACSVALSQGIHLVDLSEAFKEYEAPLGRMRILEGIEGSLIIDDTYNSSPIALEAALLTLKSLQGYTRKIAVLGDMLELGSYSEDEHERLGRLVPKAADILVTVGREAEGFGEGAVESGMAKSLIFKLPNSKEAGDFLKKFIQEGDAVLLKGSQGIRMEKIAEKILARPEEKKTLLVRQEKEWQKR